MSRRAEMRRRAREQHRRCGLPDAEEFGVQPGWCATEGDLPEARQLAHDMLIKSMGERRTGPVSWRWWTGPDARRALAVITDGMVDQHELDVCRRIGAHLREYGGFVLVAMAPGRRSADAR